VPEVQEVPGVPGVPDVPEVQECPHGTGHSLLLISSFFLVGVALE
jgi:hypothetical protein